MELICASLKEKLWHKMRGDMLSYAPQMANSNLLMCCTCGRFLPYEDFTVEHIIPQQLLADDPRQIKTNPDITVNVRSGNILLCGKRLLNGNRKVYEKGCNGWKGKSYDGLIRELLNGLCIPSFSTESVA